MQPWGRLQLHLQVTYEPVEGTLDVRVLIRNIQDRCVKDVVSS